VTEGLPNMPTLYTERLKLIPLSIYNLSTGIENKDLMDKQLGLVPTGIPLSQSIKRSYQLRMYRIIEDRKNWLFYTFWQIVHRQNNCSIGQVGFSGPPSMNGEVEVGYYIDAAFQQKGYMTEALQEIIEWALSNPSVIYIKARTSSDNYASQRVLQKSGLQLYLKESFYWWVMKKKP
jgi:[ribosomal protein S5]-alanine N-acetyltransferase